MPVPQEQRRRPIEISKMRHRRTLEVFNLNLRTKKQLTLPKSFCVQGRRRGMAVPGAAATRYLFQSIEPSGHTTHDDRTSAAERRTVRPGDEIGRASCRERV